MDPINKIWIPSTNFGFSEEPDTIRTTIEENEDLEGSKYVADWFPGYGMNQFQILIWAQQLRKVARTRRTFQNSKVPWEKDRVVLGHILPRNIVWTHGGWQESFGVGLNQIYDACRSRTYQLRALQTKSGFTKRKEVKWQVSRCHVKFCGEFSCPLLLNPVWMPHNPF